MKSLMKVTLALLAVLSFLSACTVHHYDNDDGGRRGGGKGPQQHM